MSTSKPDWYDKLDKGPFFKKRFTEAMMRMTEANAKHISQGKRDYSSSMLWSSLIIACSLGIILSLNWHHIDPWLRSSKQSMSTVSPMPTQTKNPENAFISRDEAIQIAKKMDPHTEAQWTARFQKDVQVELEKPDLYSVWIVKALYKAGNNMIVTIDAITGQILSEGEGEAPSQLDITPENAALYKELNEYQMIDANNGWAQASYNSIIRTTDGGNTWHSILIPEVILQSRLVQLSAKFIDSLTAYVAAPDGSGSGITIYSTNDGGATWNKSKAIDKSLQMGPSNNPTFTFVNKKTGWMLTHLDAAMGAENTELFQTLDGGVTWNVIAGVTQGKTSKQGYPFEGIKSDIAFANEQDGYLTGFSHGDGVWLYASHDGGVNWQKQTVSIPKGYTAEDGAANSYSPQFFGSKDGILPVSFSKGDKKPMIFYSTHDSGKTWEQTTPLLPERSMLEAWDFIDASHGYATDGANIYVTIDGAKSWSTFPLENFEFQGVHLDFVSKNNGFALGKTSMYNTTDGGITWKLMEPKVK